jgi:hypothetical protein
MDGTSMAGIVREWFSLSSYGTGLVCSVSLGPKLMGRTMSTAESIERLVESSAGAAAAGLSGD